MGREQPRGAGNQNVDGVHGEVIVHVDGVGDVVPVDPRPHGYLDDGLEIDHRYRGAEGGADGHVALSPQVGFHGHDGNRHQHGKQAEGEDQVDPGGRLARGL